jgi:membrane-associated protease RseP (regulator of RpoE activity)
MTETLLYIAGILLVLLGIAASIGLHEIGHLVPAKLFGVRVKQYMIGFGPTLFSRTKGETEYGVKAIPLGGYISMVGMFPPENPAKPNRGLFAKWIREARKEVRSEVSAGDEGRQFYQLSFIKKFTVMFGGPFMNFLLGTLLIVISLSGIGTAQVSTTVDRVYDCIEQTDEACDPNAPISPAKAAGLQSGDEVVEVNGVSVSEWEEVVAALNLKIEQQSQITVLREEKLVELAITPVFTERPVYDATGNLLRDSSGDPVTEIRPILGILTEPKLKPIGLADSLGVAAGSTAALGGFVLQLPQEVWKIASSTFGDVERDPNGAVSIVGVGQIAGEVAANQDASWELRLGSILLLLGSLNLALFVFNLIPLLPLDGGHILGAVYERIKRSTLKAIRGVDPGPVDTAKALPLAYVVWAVLLATGIVVILADLVNPITLG